MRHLPPLNQLRAFEACARHSSFAKAAEEIGVTATAISHQIRLLEAHVGRTLFRRRPRPIALTAEGAQLFPVVRDALDRMAAGVGAINARKPDAALRVTTTNAFAARWLAPRLPRWREEHPESRVHVIGTDAVLALEADEADIAIRYCRRAPPGERALLLRDRFHVVASPALLGARKAELDVAQILAFPLVEAAWPQNDRLAPTWALWMERAGVEPRLRPEPALVFQEEAHAIEAIIAGQGLGICSDVLIGAELAKGTLVAVSRVNLPGLAFHIVYRDDNPKIATIRAFAQWAAKIARQPAGGG